MQRIRFKYDTKKLADATYGTSRQSFNLNGEDVRLFVHFKDFYYEVIRNDGTAVATGGNTKNRAVLLRQAKNALVKLGCKFDEETRDRNGSNSTSTSVQQDATSYASA